MSQFDAKLPRWTAVLSLAGVALIVGACSSGSGTSSTAMPPASGPTATPIPVVFVTPTPTPPPGATPGPIVRGNTACAAGSAPVTATVTLQNGVVAFPSIGGCTGYINFSGIVAPVTGTVTASLTPPQGFPPAPTAPFAFQGQTGTPVVYYALKLNSPLQVSQGGSAALAYTVPVAPAANANNFFNLNADLGPVSPGAIGGTGGSISFGGPAVISGNSITFPAGSTPVAVTLNSTDVLVFSLYYF